MSANSPLDFECPLLAVSGHSYLSIFGTGEVGVASSSISVLNDFPHVLMNYT